MKKETRRSFCVLVYHSRYYRLLESFSLAMSKFRTKTVCFVERTVEGVVPIPSQRVHILPLLLSS